MHGHSTDDLIEANAVAWSFIDAVRRGDEATASGLSSPELVRRLGGPGTDVATRFAAQWSIPVKDWHGVGVAPSAYVLEVGRVAIRTMLARHASLGPLAPGTPRGV